MAKHQAVMQDHRMPLVIEVESVLMCVMEAKNHPQLAAFLQKKGGLHEDWLLIRDSLTNTDCIIKLR